MSYSHKDIESKWQKRWREAQCFRAKEDFSLPKFYCLDMFPYPSGLGLHMGHLASYTPGEIVSRYKRCKGFNVLHPMGYDAFGLPAEQYAIQTGIHPAETTRGAIENFRRQLESFGYSYDWGREISTCDPRYYKWTQFIFLKLFERGLAYQKEVPVNWCPALRTVLANEEVVDGKSERGGHPVIRKPMKQWMLKITDYAEKLLEGLEQIDWPERTRAGQVNWIGKSLGARISFSVSGAQEKFEVFTTRPDTLFGATFMVLAPEHPLVPKITTSSQQAAVRDYVQRTAAKSEVDRKAALEKTGAFTGATADHPLTGEKLPIWIADYVLMDYGTGAIMCVPGHDERDFAFAIQFALPVKRVLASEGDLPYEGDGQLVNSEFLNGLSKDQAIAKMLRHLENHGLGRPETQYKLRDWLFSRQRYWGEPFPIIHLENQKIVGVPYSELPVELPPVADYEPTSEGEPPLARVSSFVHYEANGVRGHREVDTMPGSAGSSWYFLRYLDPHNDESFCDFEKQKYWMPVDLYVGGPEHTVGHLLYARFWQRVLFDAGLVSHPEPFLKLRHQGDIQGSDGARMSKSRGNGVNPDEVREAYGADCVRLYVMFLGPFDKSKPWATSGIEGVRRFLERFWRLVSSEDGNCLAQDLADQKLPQELLKCYHRTVKKVGDDIESMNFNTAISAMMIFVNELYRHELRPRALLKGLAQLLMPFAPHLAEEAWEKLGGAGLVSLAPWPPYEPALATEDEIQMAVQVNGKMRGTISVTLETSEAEAVEKALQLNAVKNAVGQTKIAKTIYKAGKILNIIVK